MRPIQSRIMNGAFALSIIALVAAPISALGGDSQPVLQTDFESGLSAPFFTSFTTSNDMTQPRTSNIVSYDTLNPAWSDFYDHTHGDSSGHFFVANGLEGAQENALIINVLQMQRNTVYEFSGWLAALTDTPPSAITMRIFDGIALLKTAEFPMPTAPGVWQRFSVSFNTYNASYVGILLVGSADLRSNDFALDDVMLSVPEPAAGALLVIGFAALACGRRRSAGCSADAG